MKETLKAAAAIAFWIVAIPVMVTACAMQLLIPERKPSPVYTKIHRPLKDFEKGLKEILASMAGKPRPQ